MLGKELCPIAGYRILLFRRRKLTPQLWPRRGCLNKYHTTNGFPLFLYLCTVVNLSNFSSAINTGWSKLSHPFVTQALTDVTYLGPAHLTNLVSFRWKSNVIHLEVLRNYFYSFIVVTDDTGVHNIKLQQPKANDVWIKNKNIPFSETFVLYN
jgi:hypothetical protein